MGRYVPFDPEAICDRCGTTGAFDFMGDYYCSPCAAELMDETDAEEVEDEIRQEESRSRNETPETKR